MSAETRPAWWARVRSVLVAMVGLATLAVLAPPPPPHQTDPRREKVVFWHMWTGEWKPIVEEIAADFNRSQDRYEVVPLAIPPDGAETKFLLTASGGDAPDLVSQWNPVLGTWADRKLIQPVEDLMTPAERDRWLAEAYPIMRTHATYKGRIMAIIAGVDVYALYYRLDHLAEVGRDASSLPATLEEVVALGDQLTRKAPDGSIRRLGFLPQWWPNYVPSFGGSFGEGSQIALDSPRNVAALEFIQDRMNAMGGESVRRFLSSQAADAGVNAPLIAGNLSIMLDGQWRVKQTKQFAPDLPYAVAPLPPPAGGVAMASMTAANYMVIPSAAKCPRGAWEFLKYWVGVDDPEAGGRNTARMGWLPYCDRVARSKSYQDYLREYPRFRPFVDLIASKNLQRIPASSLQSFATNEITKADDAVSRGAIEPPAAARRAQQAVERERARQRRLGNER